MEPRLDTTAETAAQIQVNQLAIRVANKLTDYLFHHNQVPSEAAAQQLFCRLTDALALEPKEYLLSFLSDRERRRLDV